MKSITIISHIITSLLLLTAGITFLFFVENIIPDSFFTNQLSVNEELQNDFINLTEEMPRFPGCEHITELSERRKCAQKKMLEYIYEEINYPAFIKESAIEGMTVVRFAVDIDGKIKESEIVKSLHPAFDAEALRVINKMNDLPERWTPGRQRRKLVKVYYNIPIKNRLQ